MSARLIERIAGQPWLIHGPALRTIMEVAEREPPDPANLAAWKGLLAPRPSLLDMRPAAPLPGARRAELRDGVAILRIAGPIFRHASLMTEVSGATALGDLAHDLTLARDDARVSAVLLDIDSPGGEVTGISEMADTIRAASRVKPVHAFSEGMALSAAYWLAAAASRIVVAPTASLGSLGTVVALTDTRSRDEARGVKRYEFVSSQTPGKRPDPDTDGGRAAWQRMADGLAEEFLAALADLRGVPVARLLEVTRGGGAVLGREAVAGGLADEIGGFEAALARLAAGSRTAAVITAAPPRMQEEAAMPEETKPAAAADPAETNTPIQQPDPPPAAGVAASAPDPVALERLRVGAILGAAKPGFQKLAALGVEQGWSVEVFTAAQDAAIEAAGAQVRATALDSFRASVPAPVATGAPQGDAAALPIEERAKAEFASDMKVREEFGTVERYAAFLRASDRGVIRLISKRP